MPSVVGPGISTAGHRHAASPRLTSIRRRRLLEPSSGFGQGVNRKSRWQCDQVDCVRYLIAPEIFWFASTSSNSPGCSARLSVSGSDGVGLIARRPPRSRRPGNVPSRSEKAYSSAPCACRPSVRSRQPCRLLGRLRFVRRAAPSWRSRTRPQGPSAGFCRRGFSLRRGSSRARGRPLLVEEPREVCPSVVDQCGPRDLACPHALSMGRRCRSVSPEPFARASATASRRFFTGSRPEVPQQARIVPVTLHRPVPADRGKFVSAPERLALLAGRGLRVLPRNACAPLQRRCGRRPPAARQGPFGDSGWLPHRSPPRNAWPARSQGLRQFELQSFEPDHQVCAQRLESCPGCRHR